MTLKQETIMRLIKGERLTNLHGMKMINKTMKLNTRISDYRKEGFPIDDEWLMLSSGKKVKAYFILPQNIKAAINKIKQKD